ncbi:unnamed protein product, partial [Brassica rapa]
RTPTDVLCVLKRHPIPRTNVLICILMDSHIRPMCADGHTRTHTNTHGRPMCADGHTRTSCVPSGPKSPKQSTGLASVLSPRTNVLICVLMDNHGRPVCADGHTRRHTDSHGRPMCADRHTRIQPPWAKITQTVHGKGQRSERLVCADGQPQTATDILCVLADTHGRPVCTEQTAHVAKITQTVHGKGQHAESKDQRADMCTDGQPRTSCVC